MYNFPERFQNCSSPQFLTISSQNLMCCGWAEWTFFWFLEINQNLFMFRRSTDILIRNKQKFFTVYDGLSKHLYPSILLLNNPFQFIWGIQTKYLKLERHPWKTPFLLEMGWSLTYTGCFLGPRGPLVLPPMGPVRPALKIWITYIQAYMPHESSGDSSNQPDGPMGSPRRLP